MSILRFVGRARELDLLDGHLEVVRSEGRGRMVSLRGRRQVGKSRLVSEFLKRAKVPQLFFTGSLQTTASADLARFADDAPRDGTIPGLRELQGTRFDSWESALRAVAVLVDRPAAIVLDEFPWLVRNDPGLEGTVQKLWDRVLEAKPVLVLLVGSDLTTMAALTEHGRPLFGRARELVVRPFHVGETSEMLAGAPAVDVLDSQLMTGGYPRLVEERRRARSAERFLNEQLADENTDLIVVGQRVLSGEFPSHVQARDVLGVIGSGERTYTSIAQRTGSAPSVLSRSLETLVEKGLVARDLPTSVPASREPRYRVADPYLRFWLRLVAPLVTDIARGRSDLARRHVKAQWPAYRGKAIEPVIREALARAALRDDRLADTGAVGGYWTRTGDVEVDLVGVDRADKPKRVTFVGSVKWRDRSPFGRADLASLAEARARVPGAAQARLVVVTRSGVADDVEADAVFSPDDVVAVFTA